VKVSYVFKQSGIYVNLCALTEEIAFNIIAIQQKIEKHFFLMIFIKEFNFSDVIAFYGIEGLQHGA
jgi:hypothetical protein